MQDRNNLIKVKSVSKSALQSYSSFSQSSWDSQNHTPPNSRIEKKEEKKEFNKIKCNIL